MLGVQGGKFTVILLCKWLLGIDKLTAEIKPMVNMIGPRTGKTQRVAYEVSLWRLTCCKSTQVSCIL